MKKSQQIKEVEQIHYQNGVEDVVCQNRSLQIERAAASGCLLHKLFLENRICEANFHAGLAFAKLYGLSMRSFGIHNRVKTSCQTWDQIYGIVYDSFSSHKIESLWRYILRALDPAYHDELPMREIAFALVLNNSSKDFHISHIAETLDYLRMIFEKIEEGPYRLGLYKDPNGNKFAKLH